MLPEYVSAKYLQPLITDTVRAKILDSITYEALNGTRSSAIRGTVLADICDIWIKSKQNGAIEIFEPSFHRFPPKRGNRRFFALFYIGRTK
jgi:hypothetical protein